MTEQAAAQEGGPFITENEAQRNTGVQLSEAQLQSLVDFFTMTMAEGGLNLPNPLAAGGFTMDDIDRNLTLYPSEPILKAVVARTMSGVEMQEAARNAARLLLATPLRTKETRFSSVEGGGGGIGSVGSLQVSDTEHNKLMEIMGCDNLSWQWPRCSVQHQS